MRFLTLTILLLSTKAVAFEPASHPLDAKVSIRMKRVSLAKYLEEVGRQAKLHFNIVPGLEHCGVTAFLKNRTAREALQLTLKIKGATYQQLGRSDTFTVAPNAGPICPAPPPVNRPFGTCQKGAGKAISLKCAGASLSDYAEAVYDQADASFFFPNNAEFQSLTGDLKGETLKEAISRVKGVESVTVSTIGKPSIYVLTLKGY